MNKPDAIARVFKDYKDLHKSFTANKYDLDSSFNIDSVVDEPIYYCTNNQVLGSESGHCDATTEMAGTYFTVEAGTLKLRSSIDMKLIGGPRHMIKLKKAGSNCFVYYKVFIFGPFQTIQQML